MNRSFSIRSLRSLRSVCNGTVRILLLTLGICDAITVNVQLGWWVCRTKHKGFFTCPAACERVRWKLFFRINCHMTGLGFWQCFKFRSVHTVWSRGPWMQMECRNHWCDQRRRQGCPMEIIYVDPSLNNQNHPRCVIRYYAQPPKTKYQYIYYYSIFICSKM